jgi:hypothetical protein
VKELIVIENIPAKISVNFKELKAKSITLSEKYKGIVVTLETLPESKKLTTELNAIKNEIAALRKSEAVRATAPVKVFEAQMKELEQMWEVNRQEILAQVAKFENQTRELASQLLTDLRDELWTGQGIRVEFRRAEFDVLVLLSAVTATGNLTASTRGKLEALVTLDKQLQDQTDMRLLRLENESYKAGLAAPLNRGHVEYFLFAAEPAYSEKLARLMATELAREEVAQQRMREKMDLEQKQKEELEQRQREVADREASRAIADAQRQAEKHIAAASMVAKANLVEVVARPVEVAEVTPEIDPDDVPPNDENAFQRVTVACTFAIDIGGSVTDQDIEAELRAVLAKAGIETLQTVTIQRNKAAAQ